MISWGKKSDLRDKSFSFMRERDCDENEKGKTHWEKFVFHLYAFCCYFFYLLVLSIFLYSILSIYNTGVYYLFIRGFLIVRQWVQRLNIDFMIFLLLWIKCHSIFLSFMQFVFWANLFTELFDRYSLCCEFKFSSFFLECIIQWKLKNLQNSCETHVIIKIEII